MIPMEIIATIRSDFPTKFGIPPPERPGGGAAGHRGL